jgi:hypothetical protein
MTLQKACYLRPDRIDDNDNLKAGTCVYYKDDRRPWNVITKVIDVPRGTCCIKLRPQANIRFTKDWRRRGTIITVYALGLEDFETLQPRVKQKVIDIPEDKSLDLLQANSDTHMEREQKAERRELIRQIHEAREAKAARKAVIL